MIGELVKFCCPQCLHLLTEKGNFLICEYCMREYPIRERIPLFSRGDYYFADIAENDMDTLLNISLQNGWKVGLHDFLRKKNHGMYKIASDESRSDWRFMFSLSENSRVLDMGCGLGGISLALAQRCGEIVSMDCSLKRLKFLDMRAEQESIKNIFPVCGGDTLKLPFPNEYFDLVVLNGVLEWLGIFHRELKPKEVQLAKLKDIYRILKNGGNLYIGIENRMSYVNFLGAKDHSGLRFTALMPRRVADLYCKIRTGQEYRTYTYSLNGYKRLLKKANFSHIDIYATIPTYRDVFFLASVDDTKTMDYFFRYLLHIHSFKRKVIASFSRVLLRIRLFRFFLPEYGIVARK